MQLEVLQCLHSKGSGDSAYHGLLEYYVAIWLSDNERSLKDRRSKIQPGASEDALKFRKALVGGKG